MNLTPTIVVTVKNRLEHFLKTFSFNVSQIGIDYKILYVDYDSEDDFVKSLYNEIKYKNDIFSPNLKQIKLVRLTKKEKYDIRRAKNLGALYAVEDSSILAINDANTMLGMNYLNKWCKLTVESKTFVTNRIQESRAAYPKRMNPIVNYGNIVVSASDIKKVNAYDENNGSKWGGDDDDLFHRLKLLGLREINPYSIEDAEQYSIMHSDELRFKDTNFPDMIRPDKTGIKETHDAVYKNTERFSSIKYDYFQKDFVKNISTEEIIYES